MDEAERLKQKNLRVPLNLREQTTALAQLPGWKVVGGALEKEFLFADFNAAFAFMTAVALRAEKQDHHPEWSNVYNKVNVKLSTHDTMPPGGGITPMDTDLAAFMNETAGESNDSH